MPSAGPADGGGDIGPGRLVGCELVAEVGHQLGDLTVVQAVLEGGHVPQIVRGGSRDAASQADAAATIITNAVDLPEHPAIVRCPAHDLQPYSDLGARLATRGVGELSGREIAEALESGGVCARKLLADGWIDGAALRLQGEMVVVAARTIEMPEWQPRRDSAAESAMHV